MRYIFHSVWLQYNVIMTFFFLLFFWQNWKIWRSLESYFMIETAQFFSFHFIALSRPPPSWTGCSQSVRPLVVFDRSARLCKISPEGALCVQLSVFIPSFVGFSSRCPLLVHHLLARGHCPPKLCLFRRTAVSRPEQLASRVSSRWRYLSYFSNEKVFVTDLQLHTLIRLGVSPPSFDTGARMEYLCGPQPSHELLAEPRFEPGSPSWDAGALTTTPRAHAQLCL